MFQVVVEVGAAVVVLVMVVIPFWLSVVALQICFPLTSLGIKTASGILRTSLLGRPGALRFEGIACRSSREGFRSEQSFRLRHPLARSIDYWNSLPNSVVVHGSMRLERSA